MKTVVGLFEDMASLTAAQAALAEHDLDGDIVRVVDRGTARGAGTTTDRLRVVDQEGEMVHERVPPAGGPTTGDGSSTGVDPALAEGLLAGLGQAAAFFRDALDHGGRLIVLRTRRTEEAARVLRAAGAARVYP